MRWRTFVLCAAGLGVAVAAAPPAAPPIEWPYYGADQAGTKYSGASDINRGNVARLAVA
jgi:quinoprotein glucose dehydrogenase